MWRLGGLLFGALLGAAVACGGDDGGSVVDPNETLDRVTVDEATELCRQELDLISQDDVIKIACYLGAIVSREANPEVDCDAVAQECISMAASSPPAEATCNIHPDAFGELPDCAAEITVGELQECLDAIGGAFSDLADTTSCDVSSDEIVFPEPQACIDLADQCPNIFEPTGV